jgi:hypothetical protein
LPAKPELAWGNHKRLAGYNWVRPSCFEKWSNIGWMNRIYGRYGWFNFVHFTKRQLEMELVSLAKPKLAWGNYK